MDWLQGFAVVRDILIILSTLALLATALFSTWVVWQLYRLGKELHAELRPILDSVQGTTDSVRGMTQFAERQMVEPARGLIGLVFTLRGFLQLIIDFYRALRGGQPEASEPTP